MGSNSGLGDARRLSAELEGSDFGDKRLSRRLGSIVDRMSEAPGKSFPQAARSESELEGTYRFLNNEKVTAERILDPHLRATAKRVAEAGIALAVHDTTAFSFGGEDREDLGWVTSTTVGFLGHFALAVSTDEGHVPLGVLGVSTLSRSKKPHGESNWVRLHSPFKESLRWERLVAEVEERAGSGKVIHVMDREGDSYELLDVLTSAKSRFVIRLAHDRNCIEEGENQRISEALSEKPTVLERQVELSRRSSKGRSPADQKIHPPRKGRIARLQARTAAVSLRRPQHFRNGEVNPSIPVNIVEVFEIDAPAGQQEVRWRLITTELIDTPEQVAAVIDHYRGRWRIEEYFKALKTGCGFEKRQLANRRSMLNALAVFSSVAWRLLALRTLARTHSDRLASTVLTPPQLLLLRNHSVRVRLSENPTVFDAMLAIAGLGGHLRRNGDPGWQTLGAGFQKLLTMELGWTLRP
jgi:Transposase DNA-binding/Transposase DDE domain